MGTGLLIIRLVIGCSLAAHGAQKLFGAFGGGGLHGTGAWLESIGFRPARRQAIAAGGSEFAGGLMLATGFLTPLAAAMIIGVMAVAAIAGHGGKGFFVTRGGWEYCFVLGGVAAGVAFAGPGPLSLDRALGFSGGGLLWGLFALALGIGGAAAQLATRRLEVDVRDEARDQPAPMPSESDLKKSEAQAIPASTRPIPPSPYSLTQFRPAPFAW